jgi:hypothetical protein
MPPPPDIHLGRFVTSSWAAFAGRRIRLLLGNACLPLFAFHPKTGIRKLAGLVIRSATNASSSTPETTSTIRPSTSVDMNIPRSYPVGTGGYLKASCDHLRIGIIVTKGPDGVVPVLNQDFPKYHR